MSTSGDPPVPARPAAASELPPAAPAPVAASLRRAGPQDLGAVRELLAQRDGSPWDESSTRWFVHGLDPARCVAWIAFVGAKPVGLSTLFLRDLRGPSGRAHAGYWANLYVDPAYRDHMLYPRLPLAMFAAAKDLGIEFIYGSLRRLGLLEAHTRLGFAKLGPLAVLVRPLRPLRLVGRYKGWRALAAVSPPLDGLYGVALALRRARPLPGITIEALDPATTSLAEILNAASARRMTCTWTDESFRYRYARTREGTRFFLAGIRRGGALLGGVVYRIAERLGGIRAGVVMDAIVPAGEEPLLAAALAMASEHALREDCDLMMFLDGIGPEVSRLFVSCGYRPSPERYEMILWPRQRAAADPALAVAAGWRFGFGDHDAF